MKTGIKGRTSRRNAATSISAEAKKLILATVKRYGSQRKAAQVLRLANHAHLVRMLKGEMRETPAMRAAVIRARARAADAAKRAFVMDRSTVTPVEVEQVKKKVDEMLVMLEIVRRLLE